MILALRLQILRTKPEAQMLKVDNVTQTGGVLHIDDRFFNNCRFERCQLIYAGGDFGWSDTVFLDCPLSWHGPASRTVNLLKSFGFKIENAVEHSPQASKIGF